MNKPNFDMNTDIQINLEEVLGVAAENNEGNMDVDNTNSAGNVDNFNDSKINNLFESEEKIELPEDFQSVLGQDNSGQSESGVSGQNVDDTKLFEVVAQEYVSAGTLSPDDVADVIKDVKTLGDFITKVEEKRKDSKLANLSEDQHKYLEAVESGYDPQLFLQEKDLRDRYKSITDAQLEKTDTSLDRPRKALVAEHLILVKNMSKEDALELVETYNQEKLIEKSKEARTSLAGFYEQKWQASVEKNQEALSQKEQQELEKVNKVIEAINTQEKVFGNSINDTIRTKMQEFATKNYGTKQEPINFLQKALKDDFVGTTTKLSYLLAMTNGLQNMNALVSKSATKATDAISQLIQGNNRKRATGGIDTTPNNNSGSGYYKNLLPDIEAALNEF
jgi:hypothetical protein